MKTTCSRSVERVSAVNDAAVGFARTEADFVFFFKQCDAQAIAHQLPGERTADDASTDDDDVVLVSFGHVFDLKRFEIVVSFNANYRSGHAAAIDPRLV